MDHINVQQDTLKQLYEENEINYANPLMQNGNYYHLYVNDKHKVKTYSEEIVWDNFIKTSYYYPNGLVSFYKHNKLYRVQHQQTINKQIGTNAFQWCIIDALLNDNIELIFLTGVAGSGKTYLSLAFALEYIENEKVNNIVLSRPKQDLAREEGFLPGDKDDKIKPYIIPFLDNARSLGYIQQFRAGVERGNDTGGIITQPLEKIKGRSFENSIVIVDEAEDMRYREIESLLTRLNNCKTILCGDIRQTDDNTFSKNNIPLSYAVDKFKNESFATCINNPITNRQGNVTEFVINNFSNEEYKKIFF